ncbi:DUF803-domain-containing protein [Auriscalpium vulgare]|uniref:DUF803-domain-containing protein n=1 Tax=Auriscalpium vulgare TaxID=40419 RepID=A0ACB8RVD4_9AGAM|nr:DUF803-domain-containing protein [Auriscalpium vulgare]
MSSTTSASPSASSSAAASFQAPKSLKIVGIVLAIVSGLLIGSSFVFKKKGLLRSQAGQTAGEGVAYLKSVLWWTGMIMMITGELCNFAAYAFVEALVVTPLGALSVVISAILSSIFLKEKLTFFGWLGCGLCLLGSTVIALNGPQEASVGHIKDFQKLFLAPGFIVYASVLFAGAFSIIFYFGPKYGSKNMIWYILVCSLIGGISVSVTTGLGAAIVTTAMGDNQFKYWFIYFLMVFVITTLITEVFYLNKALALFNTAMVTPTYYVIFTFCSLVTTVVLFQGLKASVSQIITIVMGFLVICVGITILQMSKIDPQDFKKLDRRSTMLLQAARAQTESVDEKNVSGIEDPGMDALRGSFGTVGSIIRARSARRMSQSSRSSSRIPPGPRFADLESGVPDFKPAGLPSMSGQLSGLKRHQLFDPPVPHFDGASDANSERISMTSQPSARKPTIKFGEEDVVHSYHRSAAGKDESAVHEHRVAQRGSPLSPGSASTPLSPPNFQRSPSSSPSRLVGPPLDAEVYGLRTAPPRLGLGLDQAPYVDPFDGSPSTSTVASFPSATLDSPEIDNHGHHRRHSAYSGSRSYPRGNQADDEEESMRLVDRQSVDRQSEADSEGDGELGLTSSPPRGGIRLVPSSKTTRF